MATTVDQLRADSDTATASATGRHRIATVLAAGGIGAVIGSVVLIGLLHVVAPTSAISPVTRTISEYGLSSLAWVFNLGVGLLVLGSVALFGGLVVLRRFSVGGIAFGALWVIGLVAIVAYPKRSVALQTDGTVHRLASLVAFVALPIAVLLLSRRRRSSGRRLIRVAGGLAWFSLAWFLPIIYAIASSRAWWTVIPLGLVERGLALSEVAALLVLGSSAIRVGPVLTSAAASSRQRCENRWRTGR